MLLAAIAVMVALFATAACAGPNRYRKMQDFLNESQRGDKITALAGNDEIYAGTYDIL